MKSGRTAAIIPVSLLAAALSTSPHGCIVDSTCYNDADCPADTVCRSGACVEPCRSDQDCGANQYCEITLGDCLDAECSADGDCGDPGLRCRNHHCVPRGGLACPIGMVAIADRYCMDVYEASRPDATADSAGIDERLATNRAGVLPWFPVTLGQARAACHNAGKRLCALDEWVVACRGEANTVYVYGNEYDAQICNGIDTFCHCGPGTACADREPCPFPHCRKECGASFHPTPTGEFPDCVNEWGVYDINGNVWELADSTDGQEHFRGGAYNCGDSERLHRCDHDGTWGPSARGFRCCGDGQSQ